MNLRELAEKYGSDKARHGYCEVYEALWGPVREEIKTVLEIGVFNGASLKMWLDFFPNAKVVGMDNGQYGDRSQWPTDDRCAVALKDQRSVSQLWQVANEFGPFDIIIDDGGHTMWEQQISLAALMPHVRPGGWYVVEDLYTSVTPYTIVGSKLLTTGAVECYQSTLGLLRHLGDIGARVDIFDTGKEKKKHSMTGVVFVPREAE